MGSTINACCSLHCCSLGHLDRACLFESGTKQLQVTWLRSSRYVKKSSDCLEPSPLRPAETFIPEIMSPTLGTDPTSAIPHRNLMQSMVIMFTLLACPMPSQCSLHTRSAHSIGRQRCLHTSSSPSAIGVIGCGCLLAVSSSCTCIKRNQDCQSCSCQQLQECNRTMYLYAAVKSRCYHAGL